MLLVGRADAGWTPPSGSDSESVPVLNHKEAALGITITFTTIAWVCTLMRLYTRFIILRCPWWDDFFIVLSILSTTVGSVIYCILFNYGQGTRHLNTMTLDEVNAFLKVFYIGTVTYPLSQMLIKLAVLFQYLRIFGSNSMRRKITKVLIYVVALWGLIYVFPSWIPCSPPSDMWNVAKINRHCWAFASPDISEAMGFYISHSATTTMLDFIIFLLPMNLYFRSDTHRNTRIALLCLFGLAIAVNLCSIGRLIYSMTPTLGSLWDLTWNGPTTSGLAAIEINLAAICAALPIFWPVIREKWGRILVTREVKITSEDGTFMPLGSSMGSRSHTDQSQKIELKEGEGGAPRGFEHTEWNPYVRDTKTAYGDIETTVQSHKPSKAGDRETFFLGIMK